MRRSTGAMYWYYMPLFQVTLFTALSSNCLHAQDRTRAIKQTRFLADWGTFPYMIQYSAVPEI